jgi:predicted nuclease of predicted toxin-antitoxin system
MKVVIDAQLPRRLAHILNDLGWDAVHTLDLHRLGNETPDPIVASLADADNRFVVTKDADFIFSHLLGKPPKRLIVVTTGNITNQALVELFQAHAQEVAELAETTNRLTLSRNGIVVGLPS